MYKRTHFPSRCERENSSGSSWIPVCDGRVSVVCDKKGRVRLVQSGPSETGLPLRSGTLFFSGSRCRRLQGGSVLGSGLSVT